MDQNQFQILLQHLQIQQQLLEAILKELEKANVYHIPYPRGN